MPGLDGRPPFVGRERELGRLQSVLDAAAAGQGGIVLVAGEPGIGKTRLLAEFAERAGAEGWQVLAGRAYDTEGMPPYLPFTEALHDYVRTCPLDALRAQVDDAGPEVALLALDIRRRLPDLAAIPPASPEDQRYRLSESVADFLLAIARWSESRGLLLLLDDLHWADRSSLLLLQHLARHLARAPVLLAGAYRTVGLSRDHPLAELLAELRREGLAERLPLGALAAAELARLIARLTGRRPAAAVVEAIERQTDGNPFFVGELVRHLQAEGRDLAAPEAVFAAAAIPEGVREVIDRRLARLSGAANALLRMGAVLGDGFSFEVLQAALGSLPVPLVGAGLKPARGRNEGTNLLDTLDEVIVAGMLREQDGAYHFSHALIRQALYDALSQPRRQRLHLRAAEAIERAQVQNPTPYLAALAVHYRLSGPVADAAKTIDCLVRAADAARAVYAYGEAAQHLEHALQVHMLADPGNESKRCDLLLATGETLSLAGELQRVIETVAPEALALAEAIGSQERASRACQVALLALHRQAGQPVFGTPEFGCWLEQADRHAPPGSLDRVRTDVWLAWRDYHGNRQRAGVELAQRALALAREFDDDEALYLAAGLILNMRLPEYQEARLRLAEESSRWPQGRASAGTYGGHLITNGGFAFLAWGELARAEEASRRLKELAQRTRASGRLVSSLFSDLVLIAITSPPEEAVKAGEQYRLRVEEAGMPGLGRHNAFNWTLRPLCELGRAAEALAAQPQDARRAVAEGRSLVFAADSAPVLAHLGRWDEVRVLLDRLCERLHTADASFGLSYAPLTNYVEAAVLAQDRELAALILPRLVPCAGLINEVFPTVIARHLGAASALLGELETARRYYEQALVVAGKVGFRAESALTHLQLAELLVDAEKTWASLKPTPTETREGGSGGARHAVPSPSDAQRREASQHLDVAIPALGEMRMQPALDRALRLAERLGSTTPDTSHPTPSAPAYPDGLSERQVEVLRLIAAGKSNPAIAEALVISLNTVARHVNHIFTKTGAANRVEAATYAHRHGLI